LSIPGTNSETQRSSTIAANITRKKATIDAASSVLSLILDRRAAAGVAVKRG
jgi:hypothetical protein